MIIQTSVKDNEDLDLLCNTLNAQAGRFLYSDPHLYTVILRAQAAIVTLKKELDVVGSDYEYMAPVEIRRAYGIDVGDIIAGYFVPYSEIEKFKDPSMPIRQAREIVYDKLDQKGYRIAYGDMIVYRNCKIKLGNEEETGVYVCAKGR